LLERLEACTAHTWSELQPGESQLQQQLLTLAPAKLPPALLASLESTLQRVPFHADNKIVRFQNPQADTQKIRRTWWSAAAAVALSGALAALMMPTRHAPANIAQTSAKPTITQPAPATGNLVPAGFKRGVSEARDEGFIWPSNDQAHRVLKIVYKDHVTLKDADGKTYQVEQPRVEYILVPAKTD
jgi:hypothetical protein